MHFLSDWWCSWGPSAFSFVFCILGEEAIAGDWLEVGGAESSNYTIFALCTVHTELKLIIIYMPILNAILQPNRNLAPFAKACLNQMQVIENGH